MIKAAFAWLVVTRQMPGQEEKHKEVGILAQLRGSARGSWKVGRAGLTHKLRCDLKKVSIRKEYILKL